MNYLKIYNSIINNRRQTPIQGYTETHHILPKSLGGNDTANNLVDLTAREHFICHLLLTKIYPQNTNAWIKMINAFCCMVVRHGHNQQRYVNSRWYEYWKKHFSKSQSLNQTGKGNSQYGKCWIHNIDLKQSKSISKQELDIYLQQGWQKGRIINWNRYELRHLDNRLLSCTYSIERLKELQENFNKQEQQKQQKLKLYRYYYNVYNKYGWKMFKQITNYPYSKQNLVMLFERNLPDFKSQNGKKRGNN